MGTYLPDPIPAALSFPCVGCGSVGFDPSPLGDDYCSFCDGTESGHPPTEAQIKDADHEREQAQASADGNDPQGR